MKSSAILILHGREFRAAELAAKYRVPLSTLASRIERLGWSVEKSVETPPDKRFRKGGRRKANATRPAPELKEHPTNGRAFARWWAGGKEHQRYFGHYGTEEATRRYARFVAEWAATIGAGQGRGSANDAPATVGGLCQQFFEWVKGRYVKDGRPTSEVSSFRSVIKTVQGPYGKLPVAEFGPLQLRAVRSQFVSAGLSREVANRYTRKVVVLFRWGVSHGWAPAQQLVGLNAVESLRAGSTAARDPDPVEPVDLVVIEKTLAKIHPDPERAAVLAAMVRVQLCTGMRPGELVAMTWEAIDRGRPTWRYEVGRLNKNLHRGVYRKGVYLGPRARAILESLPLAGPGSERTGRVWRWRFRGAKEGDRWTVMTRTEYARHIARACELAGVAVWSPNQLRHNRATEVHELYESDADAAAALGNTPEVARRVYVSSPGERAAERIAEATG